MVSTQTVTAMQRAQQTLDRAFARLGTGQIETSSSVNRAIHQTKADLTAEIAAQQSRINAATRDESRSLTAVDAYSEAEIRYLQAAAILKNSARDGATVYERQSAVAEAERIYASIDPYYGNKLFEGEQVAFRGDTLGHLAPTGLGTGKDVALVDRIFYAASNGADGFELWSSTGAAGSELAVGNIEPGPLGQFTAGTAPTWAAANGLLYYTASTAANGTELWRSDGTKAGTFLLSDLTPGAPSSTISNMVELKGSLYFTLSEGTDHYLYKSDGTAETTKRISKISSGSAPKYFTSLDNNLYFVSQTPSNGIELRRTDGTLSGTSLVADIRPGAASSFPEYLTPSGDKLFFTALTSTGGRELYVADKTGTRRVADIYPGSTDGLPITPTMFISAVKGGVVFTAQDPTAGMELYYSDGNSVTRLTDLTPGPADTSFGGPTRAAAIGDKFAFAATTSDGFYAPYLTDLAGNRQLITSDDGDALTFSSHFVTAGNYLYMRAAEAGAPGSRLYRVDPTTAKATAIAGTQDIPFVNQTVIGDKVFATALKSGIQRTFVYGPDGLYQVPGTISQGYAILVPGLTGTRLQQSADTLTAAAVNVSSQRQAAQWAADRAGIVQRFHAGIKTVAEQAKQQVSVADPQNELTVAREASERLKRGSASLAAEAQAGAFLAGGIQDVLKAAKTESEDLQARRDAKLQEAKRQQRGKFLRGEITTLSGRPVTAGLSTIGLQVETSRFDPPPVQPAYRPVIAPIKLAGATLT